MRRIILIAFATLALFVLGATVAFAGNGHGGGKGNGNGGHSTTSVHNKGGDKGKKGGGSSDHVTICHATGTPDNAGNGYVQISPSASGVYHGHYRQHKADIIPPFKYQGNTYSLNWDSAHIAIWKNGCKPVASTTTTASTTTATTTGTTTVTTTAPRTTSTKTVTVTKTVKSAPKPAPKPKVVVKKVVKKVYLPTPPKTVKVKPHAFPWTP